MQPTRSSLCLSMNNPNRRPQRPPPLRCCQRSASSTTAIAPWRRTAPVVSASPRSGGASVIVVPPAGDAVSSRTAATPQETTSDRASNTPPEEPQGGNGSTSTGSGSITSTGSGSSSGGNGGLNESVLMTPRSSWPRTLVSSPKTSKRTEKQEPLPSGRFETPSDCVRRLELPGSRGQSVAVEGNRAGRPPRLGGSGSFPFRPESRSGSNPACASTSFGLQGIASARGAKRTSVTWLPADISPCGSVCLPAFKSGCQWERRHEQERQTTLPQLLQELQVQNKALTEQNWSLREYVATKESRIRSQEAELQKLRATMGRLAYQHLHSGRGETSFKPPAWLYSASSSRESAEDLESHLGTPTQAPFVDALLA